MDHGGEVWHASQIRVENGYRFLVNIMNIRHQPASSEFEVPGERSVASSEAQATGWGCLECVTQV